MVRELKKVDGFKGANVEDDRGKNYPVKTVLPVPAGSKDIKIDDTKVGPGSGKKSTQKAMLQDFASSLHAKIPDPALTIVKTAQLLNSMRGFKNICLWQIVSEKLQNCFLNCLS